MNVLYDGILYKRNKKRFNQIRVSAAGFSELYIGRNIIQDDIFTVIENYAKIKEIPLEWLRFPIEDPALCACTFVRGGRIFVMLNSDLPMAKQIFAAAHELYHIRCYLEENDPELAVSGSILESKTIDTGTSEEEAMEANAFAGLILVPTYDLEQQIRIYQIDKETITTDSILTLTEIFAVPYKAMVLRLLEECVITDEKATELICIPADVVKERMRITGKAKRWDMNPAGYEKLGSLLENLTYNTDTEALPQSRLDGDWANLWQVMKKYGIERWAWREH